MQPFYLKRRIFIKKFNIRHMPLFYTKWKMHRNVFTNCFLVIDSIPLMSMGDSLYINIKMLKKNQTR